MRSLTYPLNARKGAAAVELVILFPVIVLLLIGIVDYGRVLYTSLTVSNAARAGAEYGQQDPSTETDTVTMNSTAQADGIDAGTLTLSSRWFCECSGSANPNCTVCSGGQAPEVYTEVTATKTVTTFFRYPGLPNSFTIQRKATFRSQ
jgi:Flp pilus assembly protein TadG